MSYITDVVVVTMSDERDAIDRVNDHLMTADPAQYLRLLDPGGAGGDKVMSACIYAASFNHVDLAGLEDALRAAPWRFPDWVTVCILDEGAGFERLTYGVTVQDSGPP
jgi:hypothetical protein